MFKSKRPHPGSLELAGTYEKILKSKGFRESRHPEFGIPSYSRSADLALPGDDRNFTVSEQATKKGLWRPRFVPIALDLVIRKDVKDGKTLDEYYYSPENDGLAVLRSTIPDNETEEEQKQRKREAIAFLFSPSSLASSKERQEFTSLVQSLGERGIVGVNGEI